MFIQNKIIAIVLWVAICIQSTLQSPGQHSDSPVVIQPQAGTRLVIHRIGNSHVITTSKIPTGGTDAKIEMQMGFPHLLSDAECLLEEGIIQKLISKFYDVQRDDVFVKFKKSRRRRHLLGTSYDVTIKITGLNHDKISEVLSVDSSHLKSQIEHLTGASVIITKEPEMIDPSSDKSMEIGMDLTFQDTLTPKEIAEQEETIKKKTAEAYGTDPDNVEVGMSSKQRRRHLFSYFG